MSQNFSVSDDVKELISEVISKNKWEPISEVKYYPGTEVGDGYVSKHVAIDLVKKNETIRLFAKYALNIRMPDNVPIEDFYSNETYFYEIVRPAYVKFLKEKGTENGFRHFPKCYGTSEKNVIVLENLKEQGFAMFDRKKIMDEEHISLVLRTFAKFHAVSFALKDQRRQLYDELVDNCQGDFMSKAGKDSPPTKMFKNIIIEALSKLDRVKDKHILERCKADELMDVLSGVQSFINEYSILTQGDCWCNNIMFFYENGNPVDIRLVDWQLLRVASPVFDISYFFYTIASEEALSKCKFYLKLYYEELSDQIRLLGSDPEVLYPFEVLEKEWKQHCKYGFGMAFVLVKFMLMEKDEAPQMENIDFTTTDKEDFTMFNDKFDREEEYIKRIKLLAEFMIDNGYI